MRERLVLISSPLSASRITPACAGKTFDVAFIFQVVQDHPRMCGKDSHHTSHCSWLLGSPPHVRERLGVLSVKLPCVRITPACAGKTIKLFCRLRGQRDHPRMCGKDSNGSLYFRPFTPADIQNLFNFFAKHLTSSASPNAR